MANQKRDHVNQSQPVSKPPRTHVAQAPVKSSRLRLPSGAGRDSVNQTSTKN
jgi:hypothetical protein